LTYASCKKYPKQPQILNITQGNLSRNSQNKHPSIHITALYDFPIVFVRITDIKLNDNMGNGLRINNIISPVLLHSVFITGNLNGAVEIHHSNVTFSGTTTLMHNRGIPFYITKTNVTFTGSLYFEKNNADWACTFAAVDSKVIFAEYKSLSNNYGGEGSLCISLGSNVTFRGVTKFIKN